MATKGKKVAKKGARKPGFSTTGSTVEAGRLPRGVVTKPVMIRWPVGDIGAIHEAAKKAELTLGAFIRETVKAGIEGRTFNAKKVKAALAAPAAA